MHGCLIRALPALLTLCAALAGSPAHAQQGVPLDPSGPCTAEKVAPVTYDIEFRAVVTAPNDTRLLRVWMPIPPSDDTQLLSGSDFSTWPMAVKPQIDAEPLYGNRFAYFEFAEPKGAQSINHRFRVTLHELRWHLDPKKVAAVTTWPESFMPYLRNEDQAVVLNDDVRQLAHELVPGLAGEAPALERVIGWIDSNLTYDHSKASLQASSLWALSNHGGHCSDFHGLCSALTRSLGYPARVTYGMNTFPKNSPSHCKAEVYFPGYGWVSFDVSETHNMCEGIAKDPKLDDTQKDALIQAAKQRLFSGFRDNTWLLVSRGTDYDLAPKAGRKVAVVRTIYAEADGQPLPEPDPGDKSRREYSWMTLHSFTPDHPVTYPFADAASLEIGKESSR